jgi:hypothetical protein
MNGRLVALVAVGLSAALAVASVGRWQEAEGTQPLKGVRWEYKVVDFRASLDDQSKTWTNPDEETKLLNKLADDGWEYVGLVATPVPAASINGLRGHVAFKRLKK